MYFPHAYVYKDTECLCCNILPAAGLPCFQCLYAALYSPVVYLASNASLLVCIQLNEQKQIKNACGSVNHLLCTKTGITSHIACDKTCGDVRTPQSTCLHFRIVRIEPRLIDACSTCTVHLNKFLN